MVPVLETYIPPSPISTCGNGCYDAAADRRRGWLRCQHVWEGSDASLRPRHRKGVRRKPFAGR